MNPADDSTVPVRTLPAFVQAASLHPLSAHLVREATVRNPGVLNPPVNLPPPEVTAAGVADLTALFAHSLTPTEVEFAVARHEASKPDKYVGPPRNFLQAHMIIIDQLLMDPAITTTKLASVTGYSRNWLHRVMESDAFQAKLAERQKALCDPIVMSTIKDRMQGLTSRALEILEERLDSDKVSLDNALSVLGMSTKALGLGVQKAAVGNVANFIVHVPAQMPSSVQWAQQHGGTIPGAGATVAEPLDITPGAPASLAEHPTSAVPPVIPLTEQSPEELRAVASFAASVMSPPADE